MAKLPQSLHKELFVSIMRQGEEDCGALWMAGSKGVGGLLSIRDGDRDGGMFMAFCMFLKRRSIELAGNPLRVAGGFDDGKGTPVPDDCVGKVIGFAENPKRIDVAAELGT